MRTDWILPAEQTEESPVVQAAIEHRESHKRFLVSLYGDPDFIHHARLDMLFPAQAARIIDEVAADETMRAQLTKPCVHKLLRPEVQMKAPSSPFRDWRTIDGEIKFMSFGQVTDVKMVIEKIPRRPELLSSNGGSGPTGGGKRTAA